MEKQSRKKDASNDQSAVRQDIRRLGVVIEGVNENVKLIAEQYGDIKKDIRSIKETLDSHSATLASHTETLASHTEMIGSIKEDVEVMKTDIAETKTDVTIIKSDIEFIKGGIKKKVDYDEFIALERRMTLLESKVRK